MYSRQSNVVFSWGKSLFNEFSKTRNLLKMSNTVARSKRRYNTQTMCKFCGKWMRNSNLKRHNKTHADLLELNDQQLQAELQRRKLVEDEKERQIDRIKNIAIEVGASPNCYEQSLPKIKKVLTSVSDQLEEINRYYLEKIEVGKQTHEGLLQGIVVEDALPRRYKDALDIYRKSVHQSNKKTL